MDNSLLSIFYEIWPKSLYYSTGTLGQLLSNYKKFIKNPNGIGSNYTILGHVYVSEKIIKMKNSLLTISSRKFELIPIKIGFFMNF